MRVNKKILFLSHHEEIELGIMNNFFIENDYDIDVITPLHTFNFPSNISNYNGIIILGGAMNVADTDEYPAINKEIEWIKDLFKTNIPILGICLGAQMIAKASGSIVEAHNKNIVEVGYKNLSTVNDNPTFKNCPKKVYLWHTQGFTLPDNAKLLATNDTFDTQAFVMNKKIFGLQFHPEVSKNMIINWNLKSPEILNKLGAVNSEKQLEDHIKYSKYVKKWFENFLKKWLILI